MCECKDTFCFSLLGAIKIKNHDQLYADHVKSWSELWQRGRIDVEGNRTIARAVYGSLYYILSSIPLQEKPNDMFVGLSPGGLPFGGDLSDVSMESLPSVLSQIRLIYIHSILLP